MGGHDWELGVADWVVLVCVECGDGDALDCAGFGGGLVWVGEYECFCESPFDPDSCSESVVELLTDYENYRFALLCIWLMCMDHLTVLLHWRPMASYDTPSAPCFRFSRSRVRISPLFSFCNFVG